MRWFKAAVETSPEGVEAVTDCLYAFGLFNVEIIDSAEERLAFLSAHRGQWDYLAPETLRPAGTEVIFYTPESAEGEELLARARTALERLPAVWAGFDLGRLRLRTEVVCDEDWADNWKNYFLPAPIGEKLLLWPQWRGEEPPAGRVPLRVDNAALFGTGRHATTQLCLRAAEELVRPGMSVLDLGAGSGILFIAALLLGADWAEAAEIDPAAVRAVPANAALNGIGPERYRLHVTDALRDADLWTRLRRRPFDLVFANIVQDTVVALAPSAAAVLAPGGKFIVSGLLAEGTVETGARLKQTFPRVAAVREQEGWAAIIAQKGGE
ncbi:MAG: 50S ribosomal protein L11 methyltransferase [Gracilibacteraceae bacterium]|jgi:ribosomal protein L11 methyltransferase|nr:50S ribosomal protein L11 methyltransferase [Gracilibacteraceae bacterium]